MNKKLVLLASCFLIAAVFIPWTGSIRPSRAMTLQPRQLAGLQAPVRVVRDSNDIPHIFARSDHDVLFMLGYMHAKDRFFQMDLLRHQTSGTLAELLGPSVLEDDILNRTGGLRRAAEETLNALSPEEMALLQAYADGVNAYVFDENNPLPPEYTALELTKASVSRWSVIDTLAVGKGLAFQLSFDLDDIDRTLDLAAYQEALGVDAGTALFFQDVMRSAPFDPTISIPGFLPAAAAKTTAAERRQAMISAARNLPKLIGPETLKLARHYLERVKTSRYFLGASKERPSEASSNWWIIGGSLTDSGYPMLANDPHLALTTSPIWYEAHLIVDDDPQHGPMNVNGVSLAGTPVIILGCNQRICWAATVNPLDVTDIYREQLVVNVIQMTVTHTKFGGKRERLIAIPQDYKVNQVGDGTLDDIVDSGIKPSDLGGTTFLVPRRNMGPIVDVDLSNPLRPIGLSVQYTGFRATQELQTFLVWARARNLDDFKRGLESFDFGSQNWAYADVDGNIAYFTSAEMPLREDLQAGQVDGVPPFMIRDGTHENKNEWLPVQNRQPGQAIDFEILPAGEMPQVENPAQGFIISANNDPVGTTVDNDPLNQVRPGGGIYYLSPGYDGGFRAGRIMHLIQGALAGGGKISLADMMRFQANNQMLDAEVLTPYILTAFDDAQAGGAPADLTALANDQGVAEAIGRLRNWDFSTPTGIQEGYDPGDDPNNLPDPTEAEIRNSVAATIYSVWRSRMVANTIDATLNRLGLGDHRPPRDQALSALRKLLDNYDAKQGVGASGVNFFEVAGAPTPVAARDILILRSLREALDLLASDMFAAAFGNSTDQRDYRWGKLHRKVFDHPLGGPFDIPNAGGFSDLSPQLPGVARAGGLQVVDRSDGGLRVTSVNSFMFGSGPSRRFVVEMTPNGPHAFEIIAGGQSGIVGSPFYANMLGRWLTNRYHPMLITRDQVEADLMSEQMFEPAP